MTDENKRLGQDSMAIKSFNPKTVTIEPGNVKGSQQPKTVPIETTGTAKPPPSKDD